jgi:pimeloyl-ACP methyl ester carboxylesterase
MKKHKIDHLDDYIVPLNMNGLRGRMLRLLAPSNSSKEILLVYGHHASIERMAGLAEDLNQYGAITMPDLPGFGGMESFYKLGEKPTLDNLADYLASFIKLRYKRRRITIMAMSFGFAVTTRMLQKHPSIAKKVDLLVSIVGFARHDDFVFSKKNHYLLRYSASFFSSWLPALFAKHVALRGPFIRGTYKLVADKHSKLVDADKEEQERRIQFEIELWQINDIRTYMDTSITMLKIDLCNKLVSLPVVHVAVQGDRYFNNDYVEQHLRVIYSEVTVMKSKMPAHAPTVIADAKQAAPFIPKALRVLLKTS